MSAELASTLQLGLLPADYIVEATTPQGYKTLREHHKNVDFGDEYQPAPEALPPACVGPEQIVPTYFAFLTKDGSGDEAQLIDPANIEYFALSPELLVEQILYAIDQPWGVSISDVTVRASGDGYLL